MDIGKYIKSLCVLNDMQLSRLNEELNKRNGTNFTYQNLGKKLQRNTLKFDEIEDLLDILGYEIRIEANIKKD